MNYEIISHLEKIDSKSLNGELVPSKEVQKIIFDYTEYGSQEINSYLHDGNEPDEHIKPLSDFLSKAFLIKNIVVFRGITNKEYLEYFIADSEIGSVFSWSRFTSTSLFENVAFYFPSGNKNENEYYMNFIIRLPTNKNAYYIREYSATPDEHEVLLANGTLFKILKISNLGNDYTIELEVI